MVKNNIRVTDAITVMVSVRLVLQITRVNVHAATERVIFGGVWCVRAVKGLGDNVLFAIIVGDWTKGRRVKREGGHVVVLGFCDWPIQ